jgi:hypothetical protein
MIRHFVRKLLLLAVGIVAGCQGPIAKGTGGPRILSGPEMDAITAGSVVASNDVSAQASGAETRTAASARASASSGINPIVGAVFLNWGNSQAAASAAGDGLAEARLSSSVSVRGANGGASITGTGAGVGTNRAQVSAQLYGTSTSRADVAFGSVAAVACCGSTSKAQVNLDSATGGPYSQEIRAAPVSDRSGQVGSRVDIAIASSALPILGQGQVMAAGAPTRVSPKY